MACADLREELNCSICLSIYTSPVMLSCGHNFCRDCIGEVLDSQEGSGVYTCPECRAEFPERPALQRIRKLCNIVEYFLSTQPEQEEAVIFCSYCFDSRVAAVKTCLQCEASLCANHLKIHSKSLKHVLVEPTDSLENSKCSIHNELLKYHCLKDKAYICGSCCLAGEHRGHQVELLNEASDKKKETLRNVLEKLITKREETQKRVQMLQEHTREVQDKAAGIKDKVTALFGDLIEEMKVREKRVLSEVIRQEEQVLLQVFGLIQQLEIEKDELSRKVLDIEKLCNITDPLTVLKGCESVREFCDIVEEEDSEEEDSEEEDSEEEDSEEEDSDEEDSDEEDADEQYADEQYADEQYADEQYADEYYADEQYADEQYADEQYVDEQYVDEQYADEQYTEEQYADEFYADEYYAEEQHAEEQYVEEEDTQVQFLEAEEADAEIEDTENIVKADNTGTGGSDLDEVLISLTLQKSLQSFAEDLPDITTKSGFHVPGMSDLLLCRSTSRGYVAVSEDRKTVSRTGKQATNR